MSAYDIYRKIVSGYELDLCHEIWAAAQTVPGEGIEDAVERIARVLCGSATVRVPREPTEAMLEAGDECSHYMVHCKKVWDAMIAAAEAER